MIVYLFHVMLQMKKVLKNAVNAVVNHFGKIDILVNNAGISQSTSFYNYQPEEFQKIVDLNVTAVFNCSQAAAKIMKEQGGGVILNTSSMVSIYGQPSGCGYPASKFAVNGLTKSLARELGCEYIASGHYARREQDPETGRFILRKGLDPTKDQSYVLYAMTQDQLAHTLFPLGTYTKKEIRQIAQEQGFINADKPDSQDICFVPDGDYASFIEQYTGQASEPGDFVDKEGKVLGKHKGQIHYTIGQRRGLGISAPESLYVCGKSLDTNKVILGGKDDLMSNYCYINDINLIPWDHLDKPIQCKVKTRYRQPEQPATVEQLGDDLIKITFQEPQRAVTPGQAAVLYDGDMVLGGGTILSEEAAAKAVASTN